MGIQELIKYYGNGKTSTLFIFRPLEIQYCSSLGVRLGLFIGVILLVLAILIQLIPIIFCANCIITVDTKNCDL
jgi:hypothetical protein